MKVCLTPTIVDSIVVPERGEQWVGDNHLNHFGVRAWAGKKGGGKAYAIRLRDQFGVLIRESFSPASHSFMFGFVGDRPLGYFLDDARRWARDRIASHLGLETSIMRRNRIWHRRKVKILATTHADRARASDAGD